MLSQKLTDALNAQVNAEFWSAYLYLSMSLDASAKGHKGVANWFQVQFLAEVPTSWESPLAMFAETLVHERKVTSMIENLCAVAAEEKDFAVSNMLVWFVNEQVEEEESAQEMIAAFEAVEGNKFGLYMLDKELAARTYVEPSPLAAKE